MLPDEPLNLPAAIPGGEVEADVLDGEIVEQQPQRPVYVLRPVVQVFQTINVVVNHPVPRTAGRHARHIAAGMAVAAQRRRRGRTLAGQMAELAAARGDLDKAKDWAELDHKHRMERARERADRRDKTIRTLIALPSIVMGVAVLLGALSLLLAVTGNAASAAEPWRLLGELVRALVTACRIGWEWLPWLLPTAFLLWLARMHYLGRTAGDLAPKWARTAAEDDVDVAIDEAAVSQALAALRIPQITDYVKTGMPMPYIVPCRVEGRGTYCEVRLPKGLPASEIADKHQRRERLAAGLYRHTKEVWPSTGSDNSVLKLWVADKGALEEGAGPYPLLAEGFADVFKGLPLGRILKGDPARIPVIGRNTMCGGMPEQGKSTAAKVVACGYTLDVVTELRIYVPDVNFDFERFAPRAGRYVMGAEDEFIEQIYGELEELKDELQQRGQLLIDREAEEVTRELAHAGIGLHPVFVLLEEAHVAIQHKKFGKDISALLCDIVKLDRKRGVHLFVSTQAPTKDSMPRDVTRNCSNGIAFAVGDHVANDALLGQGAYRGGHRATELIPGTDRGIALCKGLSGERSEMVQVHRIQGRAEQDDITPIVNRALAELARRKRPVPGSGRGPLAITYRDLLDDLAEAARDGERVRLSELAYRLQRIDKSYYRSLDGVKLAALLDGEGIRWVNPKNVPTLDPGVVRAMKAERERRVS